MVETLAITTSLQQNLQIYHKTILSKKKKKKKRKISKIQIRALFIRHITLHITLNFNKFLQLQASNSVEFSRFGFKIVE